MTSALASCASTTVIDATCINFKPIWADYTLDTKDTLDQVTDHNVKWNRACEGK